jgi:hypothetical protein
MQAEKRKKEIVTSLFKCKSRPQKKVTFWAKILSG